MALPVPTATWRAVVENTVILAVTVSNLSRWSNNAFALSQSPLRAALYSGRYQLLSFGDVPSSAWEIETV